MTTKDNHPWASDKEYKAYLKERGLKEGLGQYILAVDDRFQQSMRWEDRRRAKLPPAVKLAVQQAFELQRLERFYRTGDDTEDDIRLQEERDAWR